MQDIFATEQAIKNEIASDRSLPLWVGGAIFRTVRTLCAMAHANVQPVDDSGHVLALIKDGKAKAAAAAIKRLCLNEVIRG